MIIMAYYYYYYNYYYYLAGEICVKLIDDVTRRFTKTHNATLISLSPQNRLRYQSVSVRFVVGWT